MGVKNEIQFAFMFEDPQEIDETEVGGRRPPFGVPKRQNVTTNETTTETTNSTTSEVECLEDDEREECQPEYYEIECAECEDEQTEA